jgi:hypothetical protein
VATQTEDGRPLRISTLIVEYTREWLVVKVARRLRSPDILEQLGYLFYTRAAPSFIALLVLTMVLSLQQRLSGTGWNN